MWFVAVSLPILGVLLVAWVGKLADRWYRSVEQDFEKSYECPVPAEELAEALLSGAGLSGWSVEFDPGGPRCDWRRKEIHLGQPRQSRNLRAVFEAAHEVGHAVVGPGFWQSRPALWRLAWTGCLALSLAGGTLGKWWLPGVLVCVVLWGLAGSYRSEVRASEYAAEALRRHGRFGISEKAFERRLAIDLWYQAADCLAKLVAVVGAAVCFYWWGRWVIGVLS